MLTHPRPQHTYRPARPARPSLRRANTAEQHAHLASRLTPRDRWLAAMLHEHRVLTTRQITACAFSSRRVGARRLLELYQARVLDRFQPFATVGSAPMHYVLGPAGATVLAHARHTPPLTVGAWWSETRCAAHYGDLVRPDAYGRVTESESTVDFFLEHDTGTENLARLAAKISGYARLAASTGLATPVLFWLPTTRRETTARQLLHRAWAQSDHPHSVPVATATRELLDPHTGPERRAGTPATDLWLPLDQPGTRRALTGLPAAWPHLEQPAPAPASSEPGNTMRLPAPTPCAPRAPQIGARGC